MCCWIVKHRTTTTGMPDFNNLDQERCLGTASGATALGLALEGGPALFSVCSSIPMEIPILWPRAVMVGPRRRVLLTPPQTLMCLITTNINNDDDEEKDQERAQEIYQEGERVDRQGTRIKAFSQKSRDEPLT